MEELTFGHVHLLGQLQHVVESWRDLLLCLLQDVDQFPGLFGIAGGEETVGRARLFGPSRAANTMNIVLRVIREIKVYHKLDVVDICG